MYSWQEEKKTQPNPYSLAYLPPCTKFPSRLFRTVAVFAVISGNEVAGSDARGGGVYVYSGGNTVSYYGGGVYMSGGTANLVRANITDNKPDNIYPEQTP